MNKAGNPQLYVGKETSGETSRQELCPCAHNFLTFILQAWRGASAGQQGETSTAQHCQTQGDQSSHQRGHCK